VSSVSSSVGATVDVTSISSEVTTTRNTPQPTLSLAVDEAAAVNDVNNNDGNNESSAAAMVVYVLVGVLVFAAIAAGLIFLRRRLISKVGIETNKSIGVGTELTAVQVQTPTASRTGEVPRQSSKAGSVFVFLLEEAKISSTRSLLLAEKFAEHGYESACDFEGMTEVELSDDNLGDVIGLFLPEIRKFRAAATRGVVQAVMGSSDEPITVESLDEHVHELVEISSLPTQKFKNTQSTTKTFIHL